MADIAPTRTRPEPPASEDSRSQRPHIPRRLHANSFRSKAQWGSGNHSHLRNNSKDTVQSAVELRPPTTFDHLLRRDKRTSDITMKASSEAVPKADAMSSVQQSTIAEESARPGDVANAKRQNLRREEALKASLKSVEEVGMSSTRQLDNTYYAILEKASILRSTVASLQQLANESKKMHASFQTETSKLEQDTKDNVSSADNFDQQEQNINDLVQMLHESRNKTDQLNERLESARLRVEAYEMRDTAKHAKRRTQWRVTWATLLGILVLVVAILVAKDRKRVSNVVEQQLLRIGDLVDDVAAPVRSRPSPSEDPHLRKLFDEL